MYLPFGLHLRSKAKKLNKQNNNPIRLNPLPKEHIGKGQMGYIFELNGHEEKVTLFALHYLQAQQYINCHPLFSTLEILNIQTFRPIVALTEKNVMNGNFIWVGISNMALDGWMQKHIFLNSYN